jgi:hypothetical protein
VTDAATEALVDFFFVMTYQTYPPAGGYVVETTDGIIPLAASTGRRSAFRKIMDVCREHAGVSADASFSVLFFYLEPDSLSAAGRVPAEVTP